jgi:hypothetical protein
MDMNMNTDINIDINIGMISLLIDEYNKIPLCAVVSIREK